MVSSYYEAIFPLTFVSRVPLGEPVDTSYEMNVNDVKRDAGFSHKVE